jgi:CheY-like chemotaxis protein
LPVLKFNGQLRRYVGAVRDWDFEEEAKLMTLRIGNNLNCSVLLVEDGLDNQQLIARVLRKAGAEVSVAENGQAAVALALAAKQADRAFDIILMDIQMPVMDGYEATRQLRKAGHTNPIIALTANAMTENHEKCIEAGCDDYMTKPFDLSMLVAVVAKHLAQKSLQS